MGGPTVSTDSVAQEQIHAFVQRIERLHEERTAIGKDISEVFAEAKGNGFDIKALKIVIAKRRQDHNERMELEALVEIYEAALGMSGTARYHDNDDDSRGGRARAPARASAVPTRIDPSLHNPQTSQNGLAGPANGGDARTANTKPAPKYEPASAADRDAGGGEDAPVSCVDTSSPVTIEGSSSTGGADVGGDGGAQSRPLGIRLSTSLAGVEGDEDRHPNSEPGHGHVGEMPTMATRQAGRASSDALPVRAVVPGGVHIPHHGVVRA